MGLPLVPEDLLALLVRHGGLEGATPRRAYVAVSGAPELVLVNASDEGCRFFTWGSDCGAMALVARSVGDTWVLQALAWEDDEYIAIEAATVDEVFAAVDAKRGEELPAPEAI